MLQKLLDKIDYALDTIFMNNASDDVKWWKRYIWFIALAIVLGISMLAGLGVALGVLGFILLLLYMPYCLLRVMISRDRRHMYGQRAGIAFLLMVVSFAGGSQLMDKNAPSKTANVVKEQKVADVSPEQKAYDDQAKYEEWIKYQEDQKLQEAYDNQAKYEEWIKYQENQKLQEAYDNQAKYEEWIKYQENQKLQEAYDNQAKYEEWLAWKQSQDEAANAEQNAYTEWRNYLANNYEPTSAYAMLDTLQGNASNARSVFNNRDVKIMQAKVSYVGDRTQLVLLSDEGENIQYYAIGIDCSNIPISTFNSLRYGDVITVYGTVKETNKAVGRLQLTDSEVRGYEVKADLIEL